MSTLENRRFLQRQITETQRLRGLAAAHPLMGPLLGQREDDLHKQLAQMPPGGSEPRTVLFFTGDPVYGSQGIDAQFATNVLAPFLEMVKTEYAVEKHGRVGERGPRKDEDEARLLLTGLPRGSFGLELSQPQSHNLFAEEQLSSVLVRLTELLFAAGKSDEEFVHAMDDVSPRVYARLPEFFRILHDNHTTIRMQTGELEFDLDHEHVAQAFDRVNSVHPIETPIEKQGLFRGATLDTWKFDFRVDDGQLISGRISSDLEEAQVTSMLGLANQPCTASLKEIRITTQGGAVRTRYELLGLTPRPAPPDPVVASVDE